VSAWRGAWLRLRALVGKAAVEGELEEEIRFHLERETERNLALGMSPAEARRRARIAFGGVEDTREAHRDARGTRWLEDALADARHAVRVLRRNPALTAAAVLTLALGIGANTAIFSAVNAVILKPLPFPRSDRLVALGEDNAERSWHMQTAAPANMYDWRAQVAAFADVAAYTYPRPAVLTGIGAPRPIQTTPVTGNFFTVLGVAAERGRVLRDAETWSPTGVATVAVISDRLWRDAFSGAADVVGRSVRLDGRDVAIVGVMPARFAFPDEQGDVWLPMGWKPDDRALPSFRRAHYVRPIARLRDRVTLDQASAQLAAVARRLQQVNPVLDRGMDAHLESLHRFLVGDTREPLLLLLGAVVVLLLIACANVGNLLLVQAAGREREAALRLTLGAGRGRLVRQAFTESLVLSLVGAAVGLALGWWGTRVLGALQPRGMLPVSDVPVSWPVVGYVLAVALLCGLLFGTAPALWSARRAPVEALKEESRSNTSRRLRRWSDALAVAEMALAILLTLGAGLLVRSYVLLERTSPGFDPHGVLAVELHAIESRYDSDAKVLGFYRDVEAGVAAVPGAASVAAVSVVPLTGGGWTSDFSVAGEPPPAQARDVAHREVTPGYFRLMRVPLLAGRDFTDADDSSHPPVVLINEALRARYFAGRDPIGMRICFDAHPDSTSEWRTIVGVVGNERAISLAIEPMPEFFAPLAQEGGRAIMTILVRTVGDPLALLPGVRAAVSAVDPELTPRSATTLDDVRSASLAQQRFIMILLLAFAGTGFLLAVIGVYGVMAQLARRRTREMGIRIALGAQAGAVQWLVVRHALALVGVAVAAGVAAGVAGTRLMGALLYGVRPGDPLTFAIVPAALALTALAASWLPARRVSRADPAGTLRAE